MRVLGTLRPEESDSLSKQYYVYYLQSTRSRSLLEQPAIDSDPRV